MVKSSVTKSLAAKTSASKSKSVSKVQKASQEATDVAIRAKDNAYAPYSKFKVGVALVGQSGKIFSGCNVENASYGGTICAERVAITKAVSEGEKSFFEIFISTDAKKPTPPCGLCRQVMAEFFKADTKIHIVHNNEVVETHSFKDLLPHAFGPNNL